MYQTSKLAHEYEIKHHVCPCLWEAYSLLKKNMESKHSIMSLCCKDIVLRIQSRDQSRKDVSQDAQAKARPKELNRKRPSGKPEGRCQGERVYVDVHF